MEPYQALRDVENALRDFIANVLHNKFGGTWEKQLAEPGKLEKWAQRREEERKRMRGAAIEERLLYYSDFYDLSKIIRSHWQHLEDALLNLKEVEFWLGELQKYRNAEAHRRELFSFQKHLIVGISGELRGRIVRFRSRSEDVESYFPRFESVRNSLGHSWIAGQAPIVTTDATLRVGDALEFATTATDPEGESLEYGFVFHPGIATWGLENVFEIPITDAEIGRRKELVVMVKSPRSYHARGHFDDSVIFVYAVLPRRTS
ncbi:MAG: Swt1 family HEPN domain-containing protein [Chthoniobacterales bacterium]